MPECAVPASCTHLDRDRPCRRRALPHTRPPRCEQHLNAPSPERPAIGDQR